MFKSVTAALACGVCIVAIASPAQAQAREYRIPAGALKSALDAYARQSGLQIIYKVDEVRHARSAGARGNISAEAALASILSGTGFRAQKQSSGAIAIVQGSSAASLSGENDAGNALADSEQTEIVVSGSRVARAGFDAPTPTTVINEADLRLGNPVSVGQALNELPQFRATISPSTNGASASSGRVAADLRGLDDVRTLTLLNGHRFVGSDDLNSIPQSLIKRVEVVTGGASAAWGSGAVAGVVNVILDDSLEGLSMGVRTGISSRGDGARYGAEISWGTHFAGGRGHFMAAGEYLRDKGIFGRNDGSRPNLDSNTFTLPNGQLLLARDVNFIDATPGGIIRSGALAGQTFNADGSLSPFIAGSQSNSTTTIGGNGRSTSDYYPVSAPYERLNLFARTSFELSDAVKLWVDASWTRLWTDGYQMFPEAFRASATSGGFAISRDNPYLTPDVRARLASGPATFRFGRIFDDIGPAGGVSYQYQRDAVEGAVGIEGSLGGGWKYSASYDHGELRNEQHTYNQRNLLNFNKALDAVRNPANNEIVCRVTLTDPTNPCRPLNLFGSGNASPEAIAYAFGGSTVIQTTKLDSASAALRGDPFSTWAGPVSIALGVDWRREEMETNYRDPLTNAGAFLYSIGALNGSFTVKEAFGEIVLPVLDVKGAALELNGAARYSDYSTSGGIWTWKTGGTLRLFDDLLLRTVYSRDIRSPSISELYTGVSTSTGTIADPFRNNVSVSYIRYSGGNPKLKPETANTLTVGGSYSPSFAPGFRVSVDYYKIDISDVIGTIGAQDILTQCFKGNAALCKLIERDADGNITTFYSTRQNLAAYKARGLDLEASYVLPLERLGGSSDASIRIRALATHVFKLQIDDGVNVYDRAGDVGDSVGFTTPKWKASASIGYEDSHVGADLRLRYVDGGTFNSQLNIVNNKIASRAYVDLGVRFTVDQIMIFANVNNLFDRAPALATFRSNNYDPVGRYFSGGVKLKF